MSYLQIAKQKKMNNPSMIANWVSVFCKYGIDGLKPHKKGRKPKLNSPPMTNEQNKTTYEETASDAQERIRQLEDENYYLHLENVILKKAKRLRQEQEAQKQKRESSVVFVKNSN